jgi:transcription elongation GreA/GreB family factor
LHLRRGPGKLLAVVMNKSLLLKKIIARLTAELEVYYRAAQFSRAEATHEQNKAESKYDTRGLEASYLARGQSKQAAELETAIETYRELVPRKYAANEPIHIGALVELDQEGDCNAYFIGPCAGGTEVVQDKREVMVITFQSPLGEQLKGKKTGDRLKLPGHKSEYRIVSVS